MPEEVQTESKIEGECATFSFSVYERGGLTVTLALPGEQDLGTKTFDLTSSVMYQSLTEVVTTLVLGLVVGLAPEVDA